MKMVDARKRNKDITLVLQANNSKQQATAKSARNQYEMAVEKWGGEEEWHSKDKKDSDMVHIQGILAFLRREFLK